MDSSCFHPHNRPLSYLYIFVAVACLMAGACRKSVEKEQPQAFRASSNEVHFKVQSKVKYAEGFSLSYYENYKLLKVLNPYQDTRDTLQYLLKPRNVELDTNTLRGNAQAQIVDIPVQSMIATSTTHIALTSVMDANDIIMGMSGAGYVYNSEIRERVENGDIVSFSEGEFNMEQALAMDPNLVMVSAGQSSQLDDYEVLMDSGINVLVNSEWLETSPLGKAEWIKAMGALLNKEKMANEFFNKIEERYLELRKRASGVDKKPMVINNMPYKGAWFVSGGNSFEASLLKDAGADYPWFDEKSTGGLRKDFEVIYKEGLEAEVWLNPGAASSKEEILEKDGRFKDFKAFQTDRIYNNNRRMSPSGGNDYWESGVVHPERLLADLIHILHPDLLPGHNLYYYQKLNNHE